MNSLGMPPMLDWRPGLLRGKVANADSKAEEVSQTRPSSWQKGPMRNPISVVSRKAKAQIAKAVKNLGHSTVSDMPVISTAKLRAAKLATLGETQGWREEEEQQLDAQKLQLDSTSLLVLDGSEPIKVESVPLTRPYYPQRRKEGKLDNENDGGDMFVALSREAERERAGRMRRISTQAQNRDAVPLNQSTIPTASAGPSGVGSRTVHCASLAHAQQERLMKLAKIIVSAQEQGITDLGVDLDLPVMAPDADMHRGWTLNPSSGARKSLDPSSKSSTSYYRQAAPNAYSSNIGEVAADHVARQASTAPALPRGGVTTYTRHIPEGEVVVRKFENGPGLSVVEFGNRRTREVPAERQETKLKQPGSQVQTPTAAVTLSSQNTIQQDGRVRDESDSKEEEGSRQRDDAQSATQRGRPSSEDSAKIGFQRQQNDRENVSPGSLVAATSSLADDTMQDVSRSAHQQDDDGVIKQLVIGGTVDRTAGDLPGGGSSNHLQALNLPVDGAMLAAAEANAAQLGLFADLSDREGDWLVHNVYSQSSDNESWGVLSEEAGPDGFPRRMDSLPSCPIDKLLSTSESGKQGEGHPPQHTGPVLGTFKFAPGVESGDIHLHTQSVERKMDMGVTSVIEVDKAPLERPPTDDSLIRFASNVKRSPSRDNDGYDSSGSWGIESLHEAGHKVLHISLRSKGTDRQAKSQERMEDSLDVVPLVDKLMLLFKVEDMQNEYRPPRDESIPDVVFSRIPEWLTQPLPWYDGGHVNHAREEKVDDKGRPLSACSTDQQTASSSVCAKEDGVGDDGGSGSDEGLGAHDKNSATRLEFLRKSGLSINSSSNSSAVSP
ncbi:hypothetical protein CEUSTIGMA_g168.t1 [Chlamydomonas eustigma]|uniref:Uncharacterized protein n=1 Tax=Chlamydomonas eustigma TaxID=1157962 RepID=A0A250WPX7_9CHLO|nr:hypothetical protein CEUSTIGMA_g168.t1 [Chlamydomonas eustigma]|eukprot:GAX72712.1 hypothetical protein CEUSTIGMA_g168.t1 [Chlamydomonas eustigma]